jgi:hypothetical protein
VEESIIVNFELVGHLVLSITNVQLALEIRHSRHILTVSMRHLR